MSEAVVIFPHNESVKKPEISQLRVEMDCTTAASSLHPNFNEDSYFFNYQEVTFGVFDGVGSSGDGQEASRIASQIIQEDLEAISKRETKLSISTRLQVAFTKANYEILQFAEENHSKVAGSTGVYGTIFRAEDGVFQAAIANVGDSRAYIFRDGTLTRLTQDQNKTWLRLSNNEQQIESIQNEIDNAISLDQLNQWAQEAYRERNIICNQIGYESGKPVLYFQNVQPGDILLLSTDGVHDNLTTQEIQNIVAQNISKSALDISRQITNESVSRSQDKSFRSKPDDITSLIIKISDPKKTVEKLRISQEIGDYLPKIGDSIKVERGTTIDSDWQIHYINREHGFIMVEKNYKGRRYSEKISFELAKRLNTPVQPEYISQSQNFTQLNYTINQLGKIKNSVGRSFSTYYLTRTIQLIRDGQAGIDTLPRAHGLRETVLKLLKQK